MSTVNTRINAFGKSLSTARKNIISAINNKGVACPQSETLSKLPPYINKIPIVSFDNIVQEEVNRLKPTLTYTLTKDAYVTVHVCSGNHSWAKYEDGTNELYVGNNSDNNAVYKLSKGTVITLSCAGQYDWWACASITVIYL
jgi:hypothetical protein